MIHTIIDHTQRIMILYDTLYGTMLQFLLIRHILFHLVTTCSTAQDIHDFMIGYGEDK